MAPKLLLTSEDGTNLTLTVNSCNPYFVLGCVGELTIFARGLGAEVITDGATIRVKCPDIHSVNLIKSSKMMTEDVMVQ